MSCSLERADTAPNRLSHFRWIIRGNGLSGIGPAEYFTVNTPNTKGHSMANGCNGTAAYNVFRMSIPEYYTSPGPATVYFDKMGNRLPKPEVRLQPGVAAADNANTSFFGGDSVGDWIRSRTSPAPVRPLHTPRPSPPSSLKPWWSRQRTPAQMMDLLHNTRLPARPRSELRFGQSAHFGWRQVRFTANTDLGLNPSSGVNNAESSHLLL